MPQEPKLLPRFQPIDDQMVRIQLSTGGVVEIAADELQSPLDVVRDVEHPDFEAMFAALRWFRMRGITASDVFRDPVLAQDYLAATFIPMEVSA